MITFNLDTAGLVQLAVAFVLPVLVGLVTTRVTAPGTKAALLAGLSLLTALGTELLAAIDAGQPYDLGAGLVTGFGTFIAAVAMHYGLWKPTGVSVKAQDIGSGRHTA